MAKEAKLTLNGTQIYPQSVTDAIKDPSTGKVLSTYLQEISGKVDTALQPNTAIKVGSVIAESVTLGDLKISSNFLVQNTGTSTTQVMSQKAVTDAIANISGGADLSNISSLTVSSDITCPKINIGQLTISTISGSSAVELKSPSEIIIGSSENSSIRLKGYVSNKGGIAVGSTVLQDGSLITGTIILESVNRPDRTIRYDNAVEDVTWSSNLNLNNYKDNGIYRITGVRTSSSTDNLPIQNTGKYIDCELKVISGINNNKQLCAQRLTVNNYGGSESKIYTRYYYTDNNGWSGWSEQQGIKLVNLAAYESMPTFVDNGMYSGVFTNVRVAKDDSSTTVYSGITGVLIVINNYYAAGAYGGQKNVVQYLIGDDLVNGNIGMLTREFSPTSSSNAIPAFKNLFATQAQLDSKQDKITDSSNLIMAGLNVGTITGIGHIVLNNDCDIRSTDSGTKITTPNVITINQPFNQDGGVVGGLTMNVPLNVNHDINVNELRIGSNQTIKIGSTVLSERSLNVGTITIGTKEISIGNAITIGTTNGLEIGTETKINMGSSYIYANENDCVVASSRGFYIGTEPESIWAMENQILLDYPVYASKIAVGSITLSSNSIISTKTIALISDDAPDVVLNQSYFYQLESRIAALEGGY